MTKVWAKVMKYGLIATALLLGLSGYFLWFQAPLRTPAHPVEVAAPEDAPAEAQAHQVHEFCSTCHLYAPPDTFPRAYWREEVRQAYDFFRESKYRIDAPDMERVVAYYEKPPPSSYRPQLRRRWPRFLCPSRSSRTAGVPPNAHRLRVSRMFSLPICFAATGSICLCRIATPAGSGPSSPTRTRPPGICSRKSWRPATSKPWILTTTAAWT